MKNFATFILFTLFCVSCDQPIKSRFMANEGGMQVPGIEGSGMTDPTEGSGNIDTSGNDGSGQNQGGQGALGPGFENCSLDDRYYIGTSGYFGACQSTQNERQFKAKFANTIYDGMCFVPVHYNSDGTSFKVGIAECSQSLNANAVYNIPTTKDVNATINGLMVIKYSSLTPYMNCMNYKAQYLQMYPSCASNPTCLAQVDAYAQQLCQNFVTYHSENYKQIDFR